MKSLIANAGAAAAADPSAIYIGIAAIVTAASGLLGALTALIRVIRSPARRSEPTDSDEGNNP